MQLLSESGFVQRITPPPLSRDKRIKMKKSEIINQKSIIPLTKIKLVILAFGFNWTCSVGR